MHGRHDKPPTGSESPVERRSWVILALLSLAQFMVILDITVVNVALPSIGAELGFATDDLQWVVTAYALFTGGLILLGGRMADLIGRRPVFLAGLLTFTAASFASGLAPSPEALIVSRAGQGLGAAMLSPAALSIITTSYEGAQRTTALSVWGAIGAGGAAAGVLFGGILTSALSWEWVFFINVPIGIAVALGATHLVHSAPAARSLRGLDLPGAATVVGALALAVYAVSGATDYGWGSSRTLGLLAISASLFAAFALIERLVVEPLVPPTTWRLRSLVSSGTVMLGATGLLVGAFFLNSLYLQSVLEASALETGLAFLPLVLVIGFGAHLGPHLLAHAGARTVAISGLLTTAAANALLALAPDRASYVADLLPAFVLLGFGIGLTFVAMSVTAMSDVAHDRAGLASGLMNTAHELGAAVGVAVFSAVALGGAGAVTLAGFASSYGRGSLVAAILAGGLALIALSVVPAFRPQAGTRVTMH
jgi:EmrB/QacA subfamily drug resistance transporter